MLLLHEGIFTRGCLAAFDTAPLRKALIEPVTQRLTTRIAQRTYGVRQAVAVLYVMLHGDPLLVLVILTPGATIAGLQVLAGVVLPHPGQQGVLAGIPQRAQRDAQTTVQLKIKPNGTDTIFVGIHELLPKVVQVFVRTPISRMNAQSKPEPVG